MKVFFILVTSEAPEFYMKLGPDGWLGHHLEFFIHSNLCSEIHWQGLEVNRIQKKKKLNFTSSVAVRMLLEGL